MSFSRLPGFLGMVLLLVLALPALGTEPGRWTAGVARTDITPNQPVWMAGYASRNTPSEGVLVPLAARALTRRAVFPSAAEVMAAYRGRGAFRGWPDTVLADYVAGGFRLRDDGQVELACAPAWEASNFSAMANNIWGLAGRVRAPMHLYCAETGSTCRIGRGRLFLRANRRSTLTVVEGSSHFLPMERPDLVREAILDAVAAD